MKWFTAFLSLLLLAGCQSQQDLPATNPEEVVTSWLSAIEQGNLEKADTYVSNPDLELNKWKEELGISDFLLKQAINMVVDDYQIIDWSIEGEDAEVEVQLSAIGRDELEKLLENRDIFAAIQTLTTAAREDYNLEINLSDISDEWKISSIDWIY